MYLDSGARHSGWGEREPQYTCVHIYNNSGLYAYVWTQIKVFKPSQLLSLLLCLMYSSLPRLSELVTPQPVHDIWNIP